MEEIKKCLYESYKMMYENAIKQVKFCLRCAKLRREMSYKGWAADWLESANFQYKMAISYKRSMESYCN